MTFAFIPGAGVEFFVRIKVLERSYLKSHAFQQRHQVVDGENHLMAIPGRCDLGHVIRVSPMTVRDGEPEQGIWLEVTITFAERNPALGFRKMLKHMFRKQRIDRGRLKELGLIAGLGDVQQMFVGGNPPIVNSLAAPNDDP